MTPTREPPKRQFERALALRRRGDARGALKIFRELRKIWPNYPVLLTFIGAAHEELGEMRKAIIAFRRATRIAPWFDVPSRALVLCLCGQGRRREAIEEMRRFVALGSSPAYNAMIREMWDLWVRDSPGSKDHSGAGTPGRSPPRRTKRGRGGRTPTPNEQLKIRGKKTHANRRKA